MAMLYPTILGFGIAGRLGVFNLLISTPVFPGTPFPPPSSPDGQYGPRDMWITDSTSAVARTSSLFTGILLVHCILALRINVVGPLGSYKISRFVAVFVTGTFWVCTTAYFIFYVSQARYGPHNGEWYAAGTFSMVIFFATVPFSICSIKSSALMGDKDPELALPQAQ